MATLTTAQLRYARSDLSLGDNYEPFSEDEMNDYFDRAAGSFDGMMYLLVRALVTNAAKFNDYTVGQTSERKSQVFAQLKAVLDIYEKDATVAEGQFKIVGMRDVPGTVREYPYDGPPLRERRRRRNYYVP